MEIGLNRPVNIEDEMRDSYLSYAMSVITSRALPDVRDGLKPSQRRILIAMHDLNLAPGRPHRKCAKIAGDTSGNYHPHGEAVVYPTLVRMAQPFNMRYPLIDGQGNFGSMDNDPPAAMRYTEARLTPIALEMLADIDMETVDWIGNYDNTRQEPTVLPGRFPNLICNGSAGIAVGMATSIPPHNLSEVVDGLLLLIERPDATVEDLIRLIPGPDFPTGGIILGNDGIRSAYVAGEGRVLVRAKVGIEEPRSGRFQLVVTELPYQTNKAALQERIADLVREKKIDGISDMRDESDRQGVRLVIEVKRDARPQTVLKQLYKHTAMQSTIAMNVRALLYKEQVGAESGSDEGHRLQPERIGLKALLQHFLDHRHEVLTRRTRFELEKAKARAHILEGLKIALDHVDAIIRLIRQAASAEAAREQLMARYKLSDIQARAILDLQLRRLAALERQEILDEYAKLLKTIERLEDLLANPRKILLLVRDELVDLKKKYGDARRTKVAADESGEITDEDIIPNIEVLVTISSQDYIKRLPSDTYRPQRRGGKGIKGMMLREEDALRHMVVANAHDSILFFTDRGWVFQLKAHQISEADRTAKGQSIRLLTNMQPSERITAVLAAPDFENHFLVMATRLGEIKKTPLQEFASVRSNGLVAMDLEAGDELAWVKHCTRDCELILVSEQGQAVRCKVSDVPQRSRQAGGVRGIRLAKGDRVCGLEVVEPDAQLLVVTANGYGKRTPLEEYPTHSRGGAGVRTTTVTDKTGPLAAARVIQGNEELMVISAGGTILRTTIASIRETGRPAQGVQVMGMRGNDRIACIAVLNGAIPFDGE
jgi:DNA gyrase subunit A